MCWFFTVFSSFIRWFFLSTRSMHTLVVLTFLLRRAWQGVDHHPGNDQGHKVFPCAYAHGGRGHIRTWEQCLIQGQRSKIGLAQMQDQNKLYRRREVRAKQSGVLCLLKERLELAALFARKVGSDLGIRLPPLSHFPRQNAQEAWMFDQVIKRHPHKRFEKDPESLSLGGERLTGKPRGKHV